ncbi:hypothetical protein ASE63_10195 [Bosea sp. Root381]|uniref:hypothetical protein n=1 Tax=Bosea sp. Root381 TaxID=1736524 RepID=UPI0006FAFCC7|nr:hypothetical protein [Bosea sp. Root381]KRD99881.1 hypothetical protein ASE63_10195 [Bosea sp. Root381]
MRLVVTAAVSLLLGAIPGYADDRSDCVSGIGRHRAAAAGAAPAQRGYLQRRIGRAERELGEGQFRECVSILKTGAGPADQSRGEDDDAEQGPETEDMFGFTQGTSVLGKGRFEISGTGEGAFGRRIGRYRAGALGGTFAFAPLEGLSIEFGATGDAFSIRHVPGLDNRSGGGFGGFSTELKWQAIKRGPASPFGLTFVLEPEVSFRDGDSGERGRGVGLGARIALDAELVPKTLFGALNLVYEIERFRPRGLSLVNGDGEPLEGVPSGPCLADADQDALETCVAAAGRRPAERSSRLGVSGALAFQVNPQMFVGGEVRYLRSYAGFGLNRFEGHALFAGPTFYAQLSENVSLSAAFSTQIAGKSKATPGRTFDLDNFPRHQAKLKLSYEF